MNKSNENEKGVIFLLDPEEVIRKKIKSSVTDSENEIYYNPETKPGIANLLTIYACMKNITIKETEEYFKGKNYGTLKNEVTEAVLGVVLPIQEKYYEYLNSNEIAEILEKGNLKTQQIAKEKFNVVKNKVGLGRKNYLV